MSKQKSDQERQLVSDQQNKARQHEKEQKERAKTADPGHPYEHHGARVSDKRSHR